MNQPHECPQCYHRKHFGPCRECRCREANTTSTGNPLWFWGGAILVFILIPALAGCDPILWGGRF